MSNTTTIRQDVMTGPEITEAEAEIHDCECGQTMRQIGGEWLCVNPACGYCACEPDETPVAGREVATAGVRSMAWKPLPFPLTTEDKRDLSLFF